MRFVTLPLRCHNSQKDAPDHEAADAEYPVATIFPHVPSMRLCRPVPNARKVTRSSIFKSVGSHHPAQSAPIPAKAKRATGRIKQYSDVVQRLMLCHSRSEDDCGRNRRIEVADLEVEVHHRPLGTDLGG